MAMGVCLSNERLLLLSDSLKSLMTRWVAGFCSGFIPMRI